MNTIQPSINNNNSISKQDIINCLTEFQKWRRGIEPYNYGPNHKDFPYTEKYIGIVIDTVIEMLQKD
jgi:hypothetical protein